MAKPGLSTLQQPRNSTFAERGSPSSSSTVDEDQLQLGSMYLQHHLSYLLWLTVPPVLLVLGFFGNVMTVAVMRGLRNAPSTACLSVFFTALAVSDLLLCLTAVLWDWPIIAFQKDIPYLSDLPCTVPLFLLYLTSMTSAWLLVAMTCQRMMSVLVPLKVSVLCTVNRAKLITAGIALTSCAANSYIFFLYGLQNVEGVYEECVSVDETMASVFKLLDLFLASLIPFLILIVANSVLIRKATQSLRMSGKSRQKTKSSKADPAMSSMTLTLIATSAAFLLLTLPPCVLDLYMETVSVYKGEVEDEEGSERLFVADSLCTFLWIGNSVVNFYIYVLSGKKFRQETKRLFSSCYAECSSRVFLGRE